MGAILLAFIAEVGIISWRDVAGSPQQKQGHTVAGLPLPADYVAAVAIFGALGLVPKDSPAAKVAALFGWGIVTATLLNFWTPSSPLSVGKTAGTSASTTASTAPKGVVA